jgi:hypothetical protein
MGNKENPPTHRSVGGVFHIFRHKSNTLGWIYDACLYCLLKLAFFQRFLTQNFGNLYSVQRSAFAQVV